MWWWIGGVVVYVAVWFYASYSVSKTLAKKFEPFEAWMQLFVVAGCLFWPFAWLAGVALLFVELGLKRGKRTDAAADTNP